VGTLKKTLEIHTAVYVRVRHRDSRSYVVHWDLGTIHRSGPLRARDLCTMQTSAQVINVLPMRPRTSRSPLVTALSIATGLGAGGRDAAASARGTPAGRWRPPIIPPNILLPYKAVSIDRQLRCHDTRSPSRKSIIKMLPTTAH